MFSLTESHRFFLCQHYVDMRKGIDRRLERGTFEIPPFDAASGAFRMPYTTLELIMRGVSLRSARYRNRMRIGFS